MKSIFQHLTRTKIILAKAALKLEIVFDGFDLRETIIHYCVVGVAKFKAIEGRFNQHLCANFRVRKIQRLFWRTAFGKWRTYFWPNFCLTTLLVKLICEFLSKHCAPATFSLAKKFGDIDPKSPSEFAHSDMSTSQSVFLQS